MEVEEMPDWAIWILIGLALGAIEIATTGFFALLFALGALVAAGLALFTENWPLQACVFTLAAVVFMWLLRPLRQRLYGQERRMTAIDRVIGRVGVVLQDIDNMQGAGQIKADGEIWSARSVTGIPIAQGKRVRIVRIEGVKAMVLETEE